MAEQIPTIEWVHEILAAHVLAWHQEGRLAVCLGCPVPGRLWAVSGIADLRYEQGGHQAEILRDLGIIPEEDLG